MATSGHGRNLLVAAIDFGTTYSGYAFSLCPTSDTKNPRFAKEIQLNKNWGSGLGHQSYKAPTSVLTTRDGEFLAFGFDAENKYVQALADKGRAKDMLMFRHFKMMLHKKDRVRRSANLASLDGTLKPALDIFSHAIRYLKDHLLNSIKLGKGGSVSKNNICWVLTVPAIWMDESKQFMREAAYRAGCVDHKDSKNLVICLEPEAASLCCRTEHVARYERKRSYHFPKDTKYMVLDCGGGTVDITVHQLGFDGKIREVVKASGGPWGGTAVDKLFSELLDTVLGKNFINTHKQKYPQEWLKYMSDFENTKKSFDDDEYDTITIHVPYNMGSLFAKMHHGKPIDEHFDEMVGQGVEFSNGLIVIQNDAANRLFKRVINKIITHVDDLFSDPSCSGLNYIFMVGGFSECVLLQQSVKRRFERNGCQVLVPADAQLSILKGAVLFGHTPEDICERKARYSYGFTICVDFDDSIHDINRLKIHEGRRDCDNVFRCVVKEGESVKYMEERARSYKPILSDQTEVSFPLFRKEGLPRKPVQYTDVPEMIQVGKVKVRIPGHGLDRRIECTFRFGRTQIEVDARDVQSGNSASTVIDFLT